MPPQRTVMPNLKKAFYEFVELVEKNPLIYNTLQFDQYSRLDIFWIFSVFGQNFENEFEKSFSLVCRARSDESIDV